MSKPRDVVVVRVSEKGDREDEHFHSPGVQIEAAMRWARERGERLVASPIPEIDVSGKLPLSKRPGLLAAIEVIEAVERAGGEIFALDHGRLTNGTRRSACRRTCSARCSNTLPRSRARR